MEGESKGTRERGREREGERGRNKREGRVIGVWARSAAWLTSENE